MRLLRETLRALAQPRRALPIGVVAGALLLAQLYFSPTWRAGVVAFAMIVGFVVIAPFTWRALLGRHALVRAGAQARIVIYVVVGLLVVVVLSGVLPMLLDLRNTFLTADGSLLVEPALFWVGGWGLGRDIELEHDLRRSEKRAEAFESQAQQAQLLAIRAHLDPHFLFNTLNAIAEWCRADGEVAEQAILTLSAMLRTILVGAKGEAWPMAKELALAEQLFSLHRVRDPGLFTLEWDVDPNVGSQLVPPMLLLPIIENAMTHGPAAGHRGIVALTASVDGSTIRVTLENPGAAALGPADRGHGSGLTMVRQRLALAYGTGDAAGVELLRREGDEGNGGTTQVVVWFPADGPEAMA
ncbi:MAG: two-component system sensor histidine kinase AlgZ [Myxococcota bacterium]